MQQEAPRQKAEAWLWTSVAAGSGLCGLGQGSQDEGRGSRQGPGGWALLSQRHETSKVGGSLPAWPL